MEMAFGWSNFLYAFFISVESIDFFPVSLVLSGSSIFSIGFVTTFWNSHHQNGSLSCVLFNGIYSICQPNEMLIKITTRTHCPYQRLNNKMVDAIFKLPINLNWYFRCAQTAFYRYALDERKKKQMQTKRNTRKKMSMVCNAFFSVDMSTLSVCLKIKWKKAEIRMQIAYRQRCTYH